MNVLQFEFTDHACWRFAFSKCLLVRHAVTLLVCYLAKINNSGLNRSWE